MQFTRQYQLPQRTNKDIRMEDEAVKLLLGRGAELVKLLLGRSAELESTDKYLLEHGNLAAS